MSAISVLVIDSHRTFRHAVARFLGERAGDALTVFGAVPDIHAVVPLASIVDPQVVLLGLSGNTQAVLRSIPMLRSILPPTRIIVLGIFDDAMYQQRALDAGADLFLGKSTLPATLIPAIHQLARIEIS